MKKRIILEEAVKRGEIIPGKHYFELSVLDAETNFSTQLTGSDKEQKINLQQSKFICRLERYKEQLVFVSRGNIPVNLHIRGWNAWQHYHELANKLCSLICPEHDGMVQEVKALNLEHVMEICHLTEQEFGIAKLSEDDLEEIAYRLGAAWTQEEINEELPNLTDCYKHVAAQSETMEKDDFYLGKYCYRLDTRLMYLEDINNRVGFDNLEMWGGQLKIGGLLSIREERIRPTQTYLSFRFVATLNPQVCEVFYGEGTENNPFRITTV